MKHINVIPEIFSLLDTALLSAYSQGSKEPAYSARQWIIENKNSISAEAYKLLTSFGLKKKGFNIDLKKWLSQYAARRAFILNNQESSDKEWAIKMGQDWESAGGVFFIGNEDDGQLLSPSIIKAAQKKGVITLLECDQEESKITFELAMSQQKHYHAMIAHFDRCAVPIVKNERSKTGTTLLHCSSPRLNQLNKLVSETALPFYAEQINGIKRDCT